MSTKKPLIIAHRGGASEAFENSFSAFEHAISIGCDSIEVDLRATKDKKIIVMHDETLDRTTQGTGTIRNLTWKEIERVKLKNGESIPTLEELLQLAKNKIALHLEVKESGFETELIQLLNAIESVFVISFNSEILRYIHLLAPKIKLGFLFDTESEWKSCPEFCKLILPKADLLNEQTVTHFKRKSKQIHAWVVNEVTQAKKLASFGVEGIITDTPLTLSQAFT